MKGFVEISWLRGFPRRFRITDASGKPREVEWLDPGDPRRDVLPPQTRQQFDAFDATMKPAAWGRFSIRSLLPLVILCSLIIPFVVLTTAYAGFPRKSAFALLIGVFVVLPIILAALAPLGRWWMRTRCIAIRTSACLEGGCCPACLAAIDSLTDCPINTVPCSCGAIWPTVGGLQSNEQSIAAAATVDRSNQLAWLIPFGLFSLIVSVAVGIGPGRDQIAGTAAGLLMVMIFAPFACIGRPSMPIRLAIVTCVPPLLMMIVVLLRSQTVNMFLLGGAVAAFAFVYIPGRVAASVWKRPGWDVARLVCESCGYDLRGAKHAACPECGKKI